ncbi:MAG: ATP-binding cassette domain-containing protein [Egibacteraceae bacterium]
MPRIRPVIRWPLRAPTLDDRGGTARPAGTDVHLRGMRFSYRPGHDILHAVDLDIAARTRVAVVGPSGAGKTTLAELIAGVVNGLVKGLAARAGSTPSGTPAPRRRTPRQQGNIPVFDIELLVDRLGR